MSETGLPAGRRNPRIDLGIAIVAIGCVVLLLGGSVFFPSLLSFKYVSEQLEIASFLGIMAAGAMLVVLLGHIDLSLPWTITGAAIVTATFGGMKDPALQALAIPAGLAFGALVGLINGLFVAVLRVPSMVWTLATNSMLFGMAVFYNGGHKPGGMVPPLIKRLALGDLAGIPNAFVIWVVISVVAVFVLRRTVFGRYLYAAGNAERAVFYAGGPVRKIVIGAFVLAGLMSAFAGMLLAGYADQAYQGMGDPYLMPMIAAVVVGGTSILGGRGRYAGTFIGAIFITLLLSILSVAQLPEAVRQIIFGVIIIGMLIVHGNIRRQGQ